VDTEADLPVLDEIRIDLDPTEILNDGCSPKAEMGGQALHIPSLDPPFSRQFGVVDDISLPNQGVKLVTAQSACFE